MWVVIMALQDMLLISSNLLFFLQLYAQYRLNIVMLPSPLCITLYINWRDPFNGDICFQIVLMVCCWQGHCAGWAVFKPNSCFQHCALLLSDIFWLPHWRGPGFDDKNFQVWGSPRPHGVLSFWLDSIPWYWVRNFVQRVVMPPVKQNSSF